MATAWDWNNWLSQGAGQQQNALAPLGQQYAPPGTAPPPAQGQGQDAFNWAPWRAPLPAQPQDHLAGNANQYALATTPQTVPDLTLRSDNPVNKPAGLPVNATSDTWENWLNQSGNLGGQQWNGRQWTGGGYVAPGSGVVGQSGMRTTVGYDARRDTSLNEFGGVANSESNWHRVNRWAMDNARDRGLAPQAAYDAALQRMHDELVARGADPNSSGFDFAGQQGGKAGTPPGTAGAAPGTPLAPTTTPTTTAPGTTPATAPVATPPTAPPGGNQPFADEAAVDYARSNPDAALAAIRGQRGGIDRSGPIGRYRESMMARAEQALLSMYGVGGAPTGDPLGAANADIRQLVQRQQSGQGMGQLLRDHAGQLMHGIDFSKMDNDQIMNILNLAGGAGTFGYGPMAQYGLDNSLAEMQQSALNQGLRGTDPTHAVLATPGGRGHFDDILARFLAAQQGR